MKKLSEKQIRDIQLEILLYVTDFCEKNNITYWLDCGTLLGAIRHKGYIPWDDDIDIGMLRDDYDRFLVEFNQEKSRFKVCSIENNDDFCYPFAKVLDTGTILFEHNDKKNRLSINIDIFVYDNAPDNDKLLNKMFLKRDLYTNLNNLRTLHHKPGGILARRFAIYVLRFLVKIFPKNFFCKKIVSNSKKMVGITTRRVGNFESLGRMVCDRQALNKFINVEFEGHYFKAMQGYDTWLRALYNDYMQLPPLDKRAPIHELTAYR